VEEVAREEHEVDGLVASRVDEVQKGATEVVEPVFQAVLLITEMDVM
jgi:hypothetical protein